MGGSAESSSECARRQSGPRFVVLEHDAPRGRHWDFMLQRGGALRTWALERPPDAAGAIAAEPLADHREAYLDCEGPISRGRGHVTRWDSGTYAPLSEDEDAVIVDLAGSRLRGRATLRRLPEVAAGWEFRFVPATR